MCKYKEDIEEAVKKSRRKIKEYPFSSIAIAAGVGIGIGALIGLTASHIHRR